MSAPGPADDPRPVADAEHLSAAAGWVVHLRSGGTTPWPEWVRDVGRPVVPSATGSELPGATQLELLRRLNVLGPQPQRVEQVLGRPSPGRGAVDLRLPWPASEPAPPRELLRLASGVLADLTAALPEPPARSSRRRAGRGRGSRPGFVVDGAPESAATVRAGLTAAGLRPEGTRSRTLRRRRGPDLAVVVVAPLDEALHQVWSRRAQRGPVAPWLRFLVTWAEDGRLPRALELREVIGRWAPRVGVENVHVVPLQGAAEHLASLLGAPPVEATPAPGAVVPLLPAHVEVLRRVEQVLTFLAPPEQRDVRRARLAALMWAEARDGGVPGPRRLVVPPALQGWLSAGAERVAQEVLASGCQVHGDLRSHLRPARPGTEPGADTGPLRVPPAHLVDAAVRMIHRVGVVVDGADAAGGRR